MKALFCAALFLSTTAFAQDTCRLKKSKDPFTNQAKVSTGFKSFDGSGLSVLLSADANPTEIDFFIWVKDNGKCFDPESTALILFEGERLKTTLRNTGSMNCDGTFHFTFKNLPNTQAWLNRLATKKVSSIKLTGSNKTEVLLTFTEEQKALFLRMASCIATDAKTLLKK